MGKGGLVEGGGESGEERWRERRSGVGCAVGGKGRKKATEDGVRKCHSFDCRNEMDVLHSLQSLRGNEAYTCNRCTFGAAPQGVDGTYAMRMLYNARWSTCRASIPSLHPPSAHSGGAKGAEGRGRLIHRDET